MAHITVTSKILGGNLGEEWLGNYDAVLALANFMRETWASDLSEYTEAGHTVAIDIEVEREASGCDCGKTVFVTISDAKDNDETYRLELYATESLTSEDEIVEDFCASYPAGVVGE